MQKGRTMTILELIKEIDNKAVDFFCDEPQIVSIFVVGSMYNLEKYTIRRNNDYDIRLLVDKVTPGVLDKVEKFQKQIVEEFTNEEIQLGFNNNVGAVNHSLSEKKYNILLHFLIHEVNDLKNFLPLTHQVQYGKNHRILYGEDLLLDLCKKFEPQYLITCHEGIDYCIDMLKRDVYKYLIWVKNDKGFIEFKYCEIPTPNEMIAESVFYSLKNVLNNLYESCIMMNEIQGVSSYEYYRRLCGDKKQFEKLIICVENRDEDLLYSYGDKYDIFNETIAFLEVLKNKILCMKG